MKKKNKKLNKNTILNWAKDVLNTEIEGLESVKAKLGKDFFESIKITSRCKGRLIISGMGKAGIIGQKFSATLSSTGTSSFWLHAAEAVHGDLGRIKKNDTVIILSYSGQTDEIKNLIPFVKKIGSKIIAITGNINSNLAQYSDIVIDVAVDKEACGLGLAPTTSTTAMLAVCDAISVVLQKIKGFKEKDFASFHPRGSLGRKLLLKVSDIMRKKKSNPVVNAETLVDQVLLKITSAHAGAATVVDKKNKIIGIFTDGDLRRSLKKDRNILNKKVKLVMSAKPTVIKDSDLASQALKILEKKKIDELPVVDKKNHPVGMLDIQDLIAAGLV
ncbi:MAG: KpsF/GutQ family sugar-phosphate isomerase [Candidatus Omnitrophica bacterium]|nr:KpsF/GutQ family sugar-phosphate isomerase [Candidatus Omnitrophota bacterium]MCF7893841.1 KpsF/GutQ family sugar-phosphate isomerase [Candidatus Omnitrophota bacterium]